MLHKFKITTCAFILCLFGLTLMTVSPVFAADSAAFKQCQQIKPQGKFEPMKQKKNCFKDLAGPRSSAEFGECQKIKPQRKFIPMKQKKNCFRDLAQSLQPRAKADTQAAAQAQADAQAKDKAIAQLLAEAAAQIQAEEEAQAEEREQLAAEVLAITEAEALAPPGAVVPTEIVFGTIGGPYSTTVSLNSPEGIDACANGFFEDKNLYGGGFELRERQKCNCVAAGLDTHKAPACGRDIIEAEHRATAQEANAERLRKERAEAVKAQYAAEALAGYTTTMGMRGTEEAREKECLRRKGTYTASTPMTSTVCDAFQRNGGSLGSNSRDCGSNCSTPAQIACKDAIALSNASCHLFAATDPGPCGFTGAPKCNW
jgi:hypothetical protein